MVSVRGRVCQEGAEGLATGGGGDPTSRAIPRVCGAESAVAPLGPQSPPARGVRAGRAAGTAASCPVPARGRVSPDRAVTTGREGRQGTVVTRSPGFVRGRCCGPEPQSLLSVEGHPFLLSVPDVWEAEGPIHDPVPRPILSLDWQ